MFVYVISLYQFGCKIYSIFVWSYVSVPMFMANTVLQKLNIRF